MRSFMQILMILALVTAPLYALSKKPSKTTGPQISLVQLALETAKEAEIAYQDKDYETAIIKFKQAIDYYIQSQPTASATDSIPKQIYKMRFNLANVYNAYAFALSSEKEFDMALRNYETAIDIYKTLTQEAAPEDSIEYVLSVLYRNTAIASRQAGEYQKALYYYDLYLDTNPNDDTVLLQKFAIYRDDLKDEASAFATLKEYADKKNDFNAYHRLGDLYRNKNDLTNAILYYEKANAIKEDPNILQKLGTLYRNPQIQQWDKSTSALEKFISLNPERDEITTAYKLIGNNYDKLKNKPKAVEYYEKALEFEYNEDIALYVCVYYYEIKNYPKTLMWSNKILQSNPNNVNALLFRGIARFNLKDLKGAKEDFERIVNDPKHGKTARQYLQLIK